MTANPLSPINAAAAAAPVAPIGVTPRFTPVDPLRLVRQNLLLFIATGFVGVMIGVGVWTYLRVYSAEYSTAARLLVTGGIESSTAMPVNGAPRERLEQIAAAIQNQIAILKSDQVINEVLKKPEVQDTDWFRSFSRRREGSTLAEQISAARNKLQDDLNASQPRNSTFLEVSLRGRFQEDLPRVLNSVIQAYLYQNEVSSSTESSGVRQVFTGMRRDAEAEVRRLEEAIRSSSVNMPLLDAKGSEAAMAFEKLNEETLRLDMAVQQARDSYKSLEAATREGKVAPAPEDVALAEADQAILTRNERIRQLRERRSVLLDGFGENHRAVREVDQSILATEQEKKKEMDRLLLERQSVKLNLARVAADGLEAQRAGLEHKLVDARSRMEDLTRQIGELKNLNTNLDLARKRQDEADQMLKNIDIRSKRPDAVGVKPAIQPTAPELVFPRFSTVVGGITALLLAVVGGLVFTRETLDQRIKSPADVKLLPGVDLLGVLPEATEDPLGGKRIEGAVERDATGLMAESFRHVRTAVLAAMDRNGYRSVMIVSGAAGAGVSAVTQNLAVSLAAVGRRVLVMEANLRRPSIHKLMNIPAEPGLAEVLSNHVKFDDAVRRRHDLNLDILTLGDPGSISPELFESTAFTTLLHRATSKYDLVLIDAPPGLITSESLLLARSVDAAVVVVRAMSETRGAVCRLIRQLSGLRADVLGVVVNGVRTSAGGYFRENYEAFYSYRQSPARRTPAAIAPADAAPADDEAPTEV
ncbi:MAG: P-loop NTPase [Planctomycetota bacterium]|nr:P-loop NTPase [Planctomycetota bacterium]